MTKQKTRKELEVALKVTTTIMLIFAVVSVGIVYMWYAYMVDSEQQLSECQEEIHIMNNIINNNLEFPLKNVRVVCPEGHSWDWENLSLEAYLYYKKGNCEVLK